MYMTSSAYVSVCLSFCVSVFICLCLRLYTRTQYGWSASSSDWKPACKGALQAWQTTAGQLGEWNPSCRAFDVYYNELHDIDTSTPTWKATYDTDPGSVDGWLSAVGGGIY